MKNNNIGGIAVLMVLAIAAWWFDVDISDDQTGNQTSVSSSANIGDFILAVSWQPAFCEQRPNKAECRSQRSGRFDATNFSLHGLWPQPSGTSYCGVPKSIVSQDKAGRWRDLPKLELSNGLRGELETKMPGYRSYLHRHEWYKHGTCIKGMSPQDYFSTSLKLLDQLNDSAVQSLFSQNINRKLQFRDVASAFSKSFGNNAGKRLIMDCHRDNGRRIIHEFKIALSGDVSGSSDLGSLMNAARNMPRSCPSGLVDPVGLQ